MTTPAVQRLIRRLRAWFPSFWDWGITLKERQTVYPCDHHPGPFDDEYYRGLSIHAPDAVVFRWLTQMRLAPYSYDWLDNLGRSSPNRLIPDLPPLAIGQSVMYIFRLLDFAPDRHLTIGLRDDLPVLPSRLSRVVVSYVVVPQSSQSCRLLVKLRIKYPPGLPGWLTCLILPGGDLLMMRRQLLNFRRLAERTPQ